jgi:hypothetical protein
MMDEVLLSGVPEDFRDDVRNCHEYVRESVQEIVKARGGELRSRQVEALIEVFAVAMSALMARVAELESSLEDA